MTYNPSLSEQNRRLRMRIAQLEELLGVREVMPTGKPKQLHRLLGLLLKREFVSYDSAQLYLGSEDAGMSKNYVNVYVCQLRRWPGPELAHHLKTLWGSGNYITPAGKALIRQKLAREVHGEEISTKEARKEDRADC